MGNIVTKCFRSGESISRPQIDVQHNDYTSNIDNVANNNQVGTTLCNQPMSPCDLRAQLSYEEVQKNLSESAEQKGETTSTMAAAISDDMDALESASKDPKSVSNAVGKEEHQSAVKGFRSLTSYHSNPKDTTITQKLSESAEQKVETSTMAAGISDDMEAFGSASKDQKSVSNTVGRGEEYLSAVTGFSSLTAYYSNPKDTTIILREKKSMGLGIDQSDNDKEEASSCASRVVRASNRSRQLDNLWDMGNHQSGPEKVNEYDSRSVQELVAHFESDIPIIRRNEDDRKRRSVQEIIELFECMEAKCDVQDEKKDATELQEDESFEDSQLEVVDLESAGSVASVALEIKTSSPEDFRFVASPTHIDSWMM